MKDKQSLCFLVKRYQQTKSDNLFLSIYEIINPVINSSIYRNAEKYQMDEGDVASIVNEAVYKAVDNFDNAKSKFTSHLNTMINNMLIDNYRKEKRRINSETEPPNFVDDEGSEIEFIETIASANAYDNPSDIHREQQEYLLNEIIQKNDDQQKLIASLLKTADVKTRQSLSAYESSDSFNAAAKLLGISDKTVKNRVRRIATHYDANRYGEDYRDYFTVATKSVG